MSDPVAMGSFALALFLAVMAGVVWLVRLEGKITANKVQCDAVSARVDAHVALQDQSRIEIVRLQEQIRHLTDLIEKYFVPTPAGRRKTAGSEG